MIKKFLLTIASLFLFYRSGDLISGWDGINADSFGISVTWAFLANLFILGAFAFAGFAWPSYRLLPEKYYEVKFPKTGQKIANKLGVLFFQKFLLATFWRDKKQQKKYFDGTRKGIKNWVIESKKAEFGHLIPFIILTFLSIWSIFLGNFLMALLTQLMNVFANFYPILLQRTHRARIKKISDRIS